MKTIFFFFSIFLFTSPVHAKDETVLGVALRKCALMVTLPRIQQCESPAGQCPTPTPSGLKELHDCIKKLGFGHSICPIEPERDNKFVCDERTTTKLFPEVSDGCILRVSLELGDVEGLDYITLEPAKKGSVCKVKNQSFEEMLWVNSAIRNKDGTWKLSKPKFGVSLDKYFNSENTVITSFFNPEMPWMGYGVNRCRAEWDNGYDKRPLPVARHFGGSTDDGTDAAIVRYFRVTKDVKICGKNIKAGSTFGIDLDSETMCDSSYPAGQLVLNGFSPSLFPDIKLSDEDKTIGRKIKCVTNPGDAKPWTKCRCEVSFVDLRRD